MTLHYSWAIPCEQALAALAARAPIVEVGAGGGYWAMLLAERGARIASFDRTPAPYANDQVARSWHPVARGGPERALRMHPERMLMLCWPPFWNSMAERALALHRGEWVAYIGEGGEGDDGCTATDAFHEALERRYALVEVVKIPQWPSVRDELELWRAR